MRILQGNIFLNNHIHFAVAFDSETILAFDNDALAMGEPEQLGEAFLTHAFVDGHAHPLFAGREHLGPDVTGVQTIAGIQQRVSTWLSENDSPEWAVGGAYDRSIVEGGVFLAKWLDGVSGNRPVVLHGSDHHTLWANSEALRRAGVIHGAPKVSLGSIDTDEQGRPSGVFREMEAKELILRHIPPLHMADELRSLEWAQRRLAELGICAAQDAWMDTGMVEVYIEAAKTNRLSIRTNLAFWAEPSTWKRRSAEYVAKRSEIEGLRNSKLSAKTIKFFADGVFGSATASVKRSYETKPDYFGDPVWNLQELTKAVKHFSDEEFQVHIHAIGDAGVALALDAIEAAGAKNAVIAHTELVDSVDIPRFAQLGVTANFEPLWAREDGMLNSCLHHLGRERLDSMYRIRDFLEAGVKVSFGSDWPVSSPDPLLGIFTAVNRALPENPKAHWTPDQRISSEQALHAYTRQSAEQLMLDSNLADLVILSRSSLAESTLDVEVLETIIGGQTVFTRR